jgi:DNA-directed RNA polymerase beta subunit
VQDENRGLRSGHRAGIQAVLAVAVTPLEGYDFEHAIIYKEKCSRKRFIGSYILRQLELRIETYP